ncbi:MAG: glycoside hydrolase family 9 protein, partial [Promethearchaeota archaeon]
MNMQNKPILLGNVYIIISSSIMIILGLLIPFLPFLLTFLGQYSFLLSIPIVSGGSLSLLGSILLLRRSQIGYYLVLIGSIIGILNIVSLLGIKAANPRKSRNRSHGYLLILPVLISYLMIVAYFADSFPDRSLHPLNWFGRNGLTFLETIFDADVFWGELWFNLLLILLFASILVVKFPPGGDSPFKFPEKVERKIMIGSAIISGVIIMLMGLAWNPSFSILNNWYSTQFAYQLLCWVPIIGFTGLVLVTMRTGERDAGKNKKIPLISWLMWAVFLSIWIYLTMITNFHPHALTNFSMQSYITIMTISYPCSIMAFFYQKIKNNNIKGREIQNDKKIMNQRGKWLLLFIIGIVLIVLIQVLASFTIPLVGNDQMFSIQLEPFWPLSHWPGWLFVGSTSTFILFSFRYVARKKSSRLRLLLKDPIPTRFPRLNYSKIRAIFLVSFVLGASIPVTIQIISVNEANRRPTLLVNQVGYFPNGVKRVLYQIPGDVELPDNESFYLIDDNTGRVVYQGTLLKNVTRYGYSYMVGNFSSYNGTGRYHVEAKVRSRTLTSYSFDINENVYDLALERAFRFLYYQRDNYEVKEIVPGYPGHHAGHMDDAQVWNGTAWIYHNLTGGWYDAGDYNKYNSWFQTQWYIIQSLAEAALINPDKKYDKYANLYDSAMPDVFDEALWGALFLVHSVNKEGIQGEDKRYMVWEDVSGYRHAEDHDARMSYWGPPERDWTTPRRVCFDQYNNTFVGYHRGYDIAATLMHVARLIDEKMIENPEMNLPNWAIEANLSNTTYLRQLAKNVYDKYLQIQNDLGKSDDVQSMIGKLYYTEEKCINEGYNWTELDDIINQSLPLVNTMEESPFWFSWAGLYLFGTII